MISFVSVLNIVFLWFIPVVLCISFILSFMQSSIPYSIFCSSIFLLMDIELFSLGLLWIQLLWALLHNLLCEHKHSLLSDKYLGVELLGHRVGICLILLETPVSQSNYTYFTLLPAVCESSHGYIFIIEYLHNIEIRLLDFLRQGSIIYFSMWICLSMQIYKLLHGVAKFVTIFLSMDV